MLTQEQKATLDREVTEAFASVAVEPSTDWRTTKVDRSKELNARAAAAARKVYELTRPLGLVRQTFAQAAPWKGASGIPLNAFARRQAAGLLGDTLPGYKGPARVKRAAAKRSKRATASTCCPHCGGSIAA